MAPLTRIKGFSLIELLVVIIIAVSIATLGAPRLTGTLELLQLKRLTQKMITSLHSTRTLAISKGKEAVWQLDLKQHYFRYGQQAKKISYPEDIDISLTTASREQLSESRGNIRFFPDGSATGGEVIISQNNRQYSIKIDWLTGRISTDD